MPSSPAPSGGGSGTSSSTSSRTSTHFSTPSCGRGWATAPTCASWAIPNQAIYGWNGADADFLEQFDRWFPGGATVKLRRNHRSTPQVLHVATSVLRAGAALATVPDGPLPAVRTFDDEWAEARGIARAIRDAHAPGSRWSDQGVLVRTNAQVAVIEEILRGAGIPCRTRAGSGLLDRPEVAAILKRWRRADHVSLSSALSELHRSFPDLSPRPPVTGDGEPDPYGPEPEEESDPDTAHDDDETRASVAALARIGRDHLALDPECSAARFARWLQAARSSGLDDPAADMVDLATFHAAKGLEWKVVHLAGIEEGFVPISHARTTADRAEEQRLLYVAVTRAERELSISWARSRSVGARSRTREPSPWLDQINLAIAELRRVGRPAGGPDAVAELRRQLHRANGPAATVGPWPHCGPPRRRALAGGFRVCTNRSRSGAARPPRRPTSRPTWSSPMPPSMRS